MTKIDKDELLEIIQTNLDMNKGMNIVTIPLDGKASFADYMVIASGTSGRHAIALAKYVEEAIRKTGFKDTRLSGRANGDWIVMDAGDVVAHIFRPEVREFYDLEKLWSEKLPEMDIL